MGHTLKKYNRIMYMKFGKMQRIEGHNILFSTNIRRIYFLKGTFFDKPSFDGQNFWNTVLMTGNVSHQKTTLHPCIKVEILDSIIMVSHIIVIEI